MMRWGGEVRIPHTAPPSNSISIPHHPPIALQQHSNRQALTEIDGNDGGRAMGRRPPPTPIDPDELEKWLSRQATNSWTVADWLRIEWGSVLSPRERRLIVLRAEGLSYAEIGDVMGCSQSTAYRHTTKAIHKLRLAWATSDCS